eukprot:m.60245 g.60245  ORF g.60245 m.60245 type:complete len:1026 (-) comp12282_c0_seq1:55-3132(-)
MEALKTSLEVEKKFEVTYTGGRIDLSSDGLLFSPCDDKVKVIDTLTGNLLKEVEGDTDMIMCQALSPDEQQFVFASRSLQIKVHEWPSGTCTRSFKAHDAPVLAMDYDLTSTLLVTGASDSTVKVWDMRKFYCTHNLRGSQGVISIVRFLPVQKKFHVFAAAEDGKIRAWDLEGSKLIYVLSGHSTVVRGLEFSQDCSTLISAGRDKVLNMWTVATGALVKTLPVFETLEGLALLPGDIDFPGKSSHAASTILATAGERGILRLWAMPAGVCVYEQEQKNPVRQLTGLYFSRSAKQLVTTSMVQAITFWQPTLETLARHKNLVGTYDEIIDARYFGNQDEFVAVATNSEEIQIVDRRTQNTEMLNGHTDTVLALDVSPDGTMLLSASKDRTVRLWQWAEGALTSAAIGVGHTEAVSSVAFSPKMQFFVTGSKDTTIKYWALPAEGGELHAKYTKAAHAKDINAVAVAPNGKLIASASQDRLIKLWRAADGNPVRTLTGHRRGVWAIQFSPVDQVLASGSADATVRIWAVGDGSCLRTLEGHAHSVLRVLFLSRGMQLVTSGSDGLVKLWTVRTSETVATYDTHSEKIWALAVSRDETSIVSGGADSVLVLYRDNSQQQQQLELDDRRQQVEMEQDLQNHLYAKRYREALRIALALKQPFRLLTISRTLVLEERQTALGEVFKNLTQDELVTLLGFVRDWNTNSRNSFIAQSVLGVILKEYSFASLVALPEISPILQALLPYTERHYARMDRLLAQSYLLDYMCSAMSIYIPTAATAAVPIPVVSSRRALTTGRSNHEDEEEEQEAPQMMDTEDTVAAGEQGGEQTTEVQDDDELDGEVTFAAAVAMSEAAQVENGGGSAQASEAATASAVATPKSGKKKKKNKNKANKNTPSAASVVEGEAAPEPEPSPASPAPQAPAPPVTAASTSKGKGKQPALDAAESHQEQADHVPESHEPEQQQQQQEQQQQEQQQQKREAEPTATVSAKKKKRMSLGAQETPSTPAAAPAPAAAATTGKKKKGASTQEV